MNRYQWAGLGVLLFVLFFAWLIFLSVVEAATDAQCLRYGWPQASVSWSATRYCIKRVNQTDTVATLRDIRRHK